MSPKAISITMRDQEQVLIRADLSDKSVISALKKVNIDYPVPRMKTGDLIWLSPDEALIFTTEAGSFINKIKPLLPSKHLIHDVSGARVVFTIKGNYLRDMLAKGAPRDLQNIKIGEVVRTRLGQIAVAFWFVDEQTVELVCFRSVADFVEEFLKMAARPDGLPVLG